jgi:hypothetical protein
MEIGASIVIDPRTAWPAAGVVDGARRNRQHLVTSTKAPPLFCWRPPWSPRARRRAPGDRCSIRAHSWASYDPGIIEGGEARFVAGQDVVAPSRGGW